MQNEPAQNEQSERKPPAFPLLAREVYSFAAMRVLARFGPAIKLPQTKKPKLIFIAPGFMANDPTTQRLRKSLKHAGHHPVGWAMGRNLGIKPDIIERVDKQIIKAKHDANMDGPITIIGWSLGGLVAREYAKQHPENIEKVITLGTPFSGDIRGNNAWRVYQIIAGHKVDTPPIETDLRQKPPAETIAFWSPNDGVISVASARGEKGEADQHIELNCRHMAFVSKPSAVKAIAHAIEE